jgi:hypothetical protein
MAISRAPVSAPSDDDSDEKGASSPEEEEDGSIEAKVEKEVMVGVAPDGAAAQPAAEFKAATASHKPKVPGMAVSALVADRKDVWAVMTTAAAATSAPLAGDKKNQSRARLLQVVTLQRADGAFLPHANLLSLMPASSLASFTDQNAPAEP